MGALVHGGAGAFREIAGCNASVLAGLGATGQLYLPARSLTGVEVSEDPQLVVAKLRDDMVRVPNAQAQRLVRSYEFAAALSGDISAPAR